jgi:hypothetical protein
MANNRLLTEQEDNAELERLCGGVDRAFRLSYLFKDTSADCSGWRFRLGATDNTIPTFKSRARERGYSDKAIEKFLYINGR